MGIITNKAVPLCTAFHTGKVTAVLYNFLIGLQCLGIMIFVVEILFILRQRNSKLQMLALMLCVSALVNMVGYLLEMQAVTRETALVAVKVVYLGKPFIMLSMLFLVLEYFKISLNGLIKCVMLLGHTVITILVITCERHRLFYTSIGYTESGLFPHLILGHGIAYMVFIVTVLCYAAVIFFVLVKYGRKAWSRKQKAQIICLYLMLFISILGLVLYMLKLTGGYDTTSVAYLICTLILSFSLFKYNLLDVMDAAKGIAMDRFDDGMVVLDDEGCIIYSNDVAKKIFGKLEGTDAKETGKLTEGWEEKSERDEVIYWSGQVFSTSKNDIYDGNKKAGTLYIFKDITDSFYYTSRLEADVRKKTEHLGVLQRNITLGLADIIESRDNDTGGHVKRTSDVVRIFVTRLQETGYLDSEPESFGENVIKAAPMHDLGKIGVADSVLNKPGRFTSDEYEEMKTHSEKGAAMIEKMLSGTEDDVFKRIASNIAHYHHEKWNGTGYPEKLVGSEIPLEARIMALADVFDALVSRRCYKAEMSYEQAFTIIRESLGIHFDVELGRHFLECEDALVDYYTQQKGETVSA